MKADGIIHPEEEKYMNQIYSDFSITINDLEDISNLDDVQTKLIISVMSDEKKDRALGLFVGMAEADGYFHPMEKEILNDIFIDDYANGDLK